MARLILAINAGSSSLKCALHEARRGERRVWSASITGLAGQPRLTLRHQDCPDEIDEGFAGGPISAPRALSLLLDRLRAGNLLPEITAAGHRIVHGGQDYFEPVGLDEAVLENLRRLAPLAPEHQEINLACVEAAMAALPGVPHVGCFDTAFHHRQPRLARLYALPRALSDEGVMSYGFHGLSFALIAQSLEGVLGERAKGRIIVAHLGSGASLCAIRDGRSIATTMGMTPLDGLPMSTRSGALDPGVVLHLIMDRHMPPPAVADLLAHRSGLFGVSGLSGDMTVLLGSAAPEAREAVDLFVYRAGRAIGSLAAALGGLDSLVFTAGIGENSPEIRSRVCAAAGWLGVRLDEARNAAGEQVINAPDSAVDVLVLPTDEQSMIARLTRACLRHRRT
ncbi:acetate/propionate family kinase [Brevundimonas sp.]|uniref:acetate/propionate family kinase n=1 Tax=Brevundimonas sp. TaxID=1871086 RepID=UPI002737EDEC|nr:acetate/propionate family kinase [Brevundimonas sp.]MDP3801801.1 acetate/propionate family kinase [Brevundimonas sp.]